MKNRLEWLSIWVLMGLVGLAAGLLAQGCAGLPGPTAPYAPVPVAEDVTYFHDNLRGVSCWLYRPRFDAAAISCLPDSQLTQ